MLKNLVIEARDRYVKAVDKLIELKNEVAKFEQRIKHYRQTFEKFLENQDKICERFGKSQGSRYGHENVTAKYERKGFSYEIAKSKSVCYNDYVTNIKERNK